MRVLRLALRNFAGVTESTVLFAPTGVTVVEGRNEAGKSSLVRALDLLFDELDSSGKRQVKAVKPVHADVGAEAEADVETGPYAFTYAKRWHKRPQTTLTVRTPRAESLTGREAHERAEAILKETLDVGLWKALRVVQGEALAQAEIGDKPWLTAALDRAAGGAAATDGREEALFDKVRAEYEKFWSERGPRKELVEADARVAAADAEVIRLRAEVANFEQDVERVAALSKASARNEASCVELERRAAEHVADAAKVTKLQSAKEGAEKRLAQAETPRAHAAAARSERAKFVADLAAADAAALGAASEVAASSPDLEAARAVLAEAEAALTAAERAADSARREAELRERDFEFRRDELDLAQLEERRGRLEAAERAAAAAEETVARVVADDKALAILRRLHEEVVTTQVRLEAASVAVRVEALGACAPEIDGRPSPLAPGETREVRVSGAWRIEVPGVLRVDVRPGAGTEEPRALAEAARHAFDQALVAARVAALDEAVAANAALHEAKRVLADRDRVAKENLRDLKREVLVAKVENLRLRVAAVPSQRPPEPPLPADYDASVELRRLSKDAAVAAGTSSAAARTRRDEAKSRADAAGEKARDGEVRARVLRDRAAETRRLLDAARATSADELLDRALADADAAVAAAAADARSARDAFAAAQPEVVEGLVHSSRQAAENSRTERRRVELELEALRATLSLRGEDGLAGKLGAAEAEHEAARVDAVRRHAQAGAAKALFDAFSAERDAERKRYVAPFRVKVESLGRTVFGADFAVEVADDLSIVSRTLDGRTVPFESLSGGAREQIGVISRIACALLAADEGGVPVVLDDAFGWSDPDRLERMGALLAVAGRSCQVILLTCDPARHRHIPGASVVRVG